MRIGANYMDPMRFFFVFLLAPLFGDFQTLERESHLYRSTQWIHRLSEQISRSASPLTAPQTEAILARASIWFSSEKSATREFLSQLRDLGVQAVNLPLQSDYEKAASFATMRGMLLIGKPLLSITSGSADFRLALASYKEYPHLFHLIELDRSDWGLFSEGILPTAAVQMLRRKGYLEGTPENVYPYSARSSWEATPKITGHDGKERRWVYLLKNGQPALNWLDPTFLSGKLAGGEVAHALLNLSQSILLFDAIEPNATATLALLTRKLGGGSALRLNASLEKLKESKTDFIYDHFTPLALLHALITENADALRAIYGAFLKEGINTRRFVHELSSIHHSLCEWSAFLQRPKTYRYLEESITAELLAQRILKNDIAQLTRIPSEYSPPTAPLFGLCPEISDFREKKEQLKKGHLLLAFFYATQPGAFSFSSEDLLGDGLYPSFLAQLSNRKSFSSTLRAILTVRTKNQLQQGELTHVFPAKNQSLLLLLHRLPNNLFALTAINFKDAPLQEELHSHLLANKWVIDLMTGRSEEKAFDSSTLNLQLDALSGKIFLLQTKAYE